SLFYCYHHLSVFFLSHLPPLRSTLFPYTTLFRSATLSLNMPDFTRFGRSQREQAWGQVVALPTTMTVFSAMGIVITSAANEIYQDRKSTRLNSSHRTISYAVFCLKKKNNQKTLAN